VFQYFIMYLTLFAFARTVCIHTVCDRMNDNVPARNTVSVYFIFVAGPCMWVCVGLARTVCMHTVCDCMYINVPVKYAVYTHCM